MALNPILLRRSRLEPLSDHHDLVQMIRCDPAGARVGLLGASLQRRDRRAVRTARFLDHSAVTEKIQAIVAVPTSDGIHPTWLRDGFADPSQLYIKFLQRRQSIAQPSRSLVRQRCTGNGHLAHQRLLWGIVVTFKHRARARELRAILAGTAGTNARPQTAPRLVPMTPRGTGELRILRVIEEFVGIA